MVETQRNLCRFLYNALFKLSKIKVDQGQRACEGFTIQKNIQLRFYEILCTVLTHDRMSELTEILGIEFYRAIEIIGLFAFHCKRIHRIYDS